MTLQDNERREFLKLGGATLAATAVSWNATSYARIVGANDRVNVGVVGCWRPHEKCTDSRISRACQGV